LYVYIERIQVNITQNGGLRQKTRFFYKIIVYNGNILYYDLYGNEIKRGDMMKTKGYIWRSLTMEQRMRLLQIAADQNWMGRL
jgi:hypothetical protein